MKTALSTYWRTLGRASLVAIGLSLLPYAWGPVYRFPEAIPFSGTQLWNPYKSLGGRWQRANLHAHGHAWGGITSGAQSDQAVADRYRRLGYDVAGVSNYQSIAAYKGVDTLPLYEHGFNIGKNHQLAIGARSVDWFDFLFWQTPSNQQYVIDRLKSSAELVSLNHPSSRGAYDLDAMHQLTGYDLIEVVNGPFTAEDVWDAALSAGRPVWAVANDDTHDLNDTHRIGVGWNMVDARSAATGDIVSALGQGRFYAALRTGALEGAGITTLSGVHVDGETMRVELRGAGSDITFIGQDGTVRSKVQDTLAAAYTFTASDTYVRTVVTTPQTTLFLNPVIRWNGTSLPEPAATINTAWTWTQRGGIALACVALFIRVRARRPEAAIPAARAVARRA